MDESNFKISALILCLRDSEIIDKTIDSIIDVVDEVVILRDTKGKKYNSSLTQGREKISIYNYTWKNDFSDARNTAIKMSKYDFCFFIDDDEYLSDYSKLNFRKTLLRFFSQDRYALYAPLIDNLNGTTIRNNARFFYKRDSLRYHGYVHEYLKMQSVKIIHLPDIVIKHTGYLLEDEVRNKKNRNFSMLSKQISDDPDNIRWHYFLLKYYNPSDIAKSKSFEKFSALNLPYPDEIEVYALNIKIELILYHLKEADFNKAAYHASLLKEYYKDRLTTKLYIVSAYLDCFSEYKKRLASLKSLINSLEKCKDDEYIFDKYDMKEIDLIICELKEELSFN